MITRLLKATLLGLIARQRSFDGQRRLAKVIRRVWPGFRSA